MHGQVDMLNIKYHIFSRVTLLAMLLAFCVVVLGAFVRLSDAGLGCPDWPGCYGALTVPESEAAILHAQTAYPDKPLQAHKAWKEMAHRYAAGSLGLLILAVLILAFRHKREIRVGLAWPVLLFLLVLLQAMLGMWTVTLLLKPVIVSAHLLGGMSTLAVLTWIAHRQNGRSSASYVQSPLLKVYIRLALVVVFAQIALGGWTSSNYAALACTDFPTCHGKWLPDMDFATAFHLIRDLGQGIDGTPLELAALTAIQWAHRMGALVTFCYMLLLSLCLLPIAKMRLIGLTLLLVLLAQVGIGIGNLLLHLPLVLAVAHNAGAALLMVIIVMMNSKITALKTWRAR
jgi:heme a synthase